MHLAHKRLRPSAIKLVRVKLEETVFFTLSSTGELFMTHTPTAAHGSDTRRHKLTGDVHLLLFNRDGQVLFGRRRNTGFEDGAYHLTGVRAGSLAVAC